MKAVASWAACAALCAGLGLPAFAQDDAPDEAVAADETTATETMSEGTTPEAAEPEADAAPVEELPADADATEEVSEEESSEEVVEEDAGDAEPREPLKLYAGIDIVRSTLSLSSPGATGANEFDSGMYRARFGWRALDAVGVELHYGVDNSDDEPGSVETQDYLGAFVVPTATLFEVMELAFPVGYAMNSFGAGGSAIDGRDFNSIAFGADAELPLRTFGGGMPDIRLTAGWMVYYQKSDARAYGANLGLRYDFSFGGDSAAAE